MCSLFPHTSDASYLQLQLKCFYQNFPSRLTEIALLWLLPATKGRRLNVVTMLNCHHQRLGLAALFICACGGKT